MKTEEMISVGVNLMEAAIGAEVFEAMRGNDPLIQYADDNLRVAVEALNLEFATKDKLFSLIWGLVTAYEEIAILYGIRLADSLRYLSEHPGEYSKVMLERVRGVA